MAGIQAVIRRKINTKQLSMFKDTYDEIVYKIYLGSCHWISDKHIAMVLNIPQQQVRDTLHSLAGYPGCKELVDRPA
jgi:hypothetical protein